MLPITEDNNGLCTATFFINFANPMTCFNAIACTTFSSISATISVAVFSKLLMLTLSGFPCYNISLPLPNYSKLLEDDLTTTTLSSN